MLNKGNTGMPTSGYNGALHVGVIGVGGFGTVCNFTTFFRKAFAAVREAACNSEHELTQTVKLAMWAIEQRAAAQKYISTGEVG